ncbi:uncharacterized protein LOC144607169 [Rhinoraja longicauda]
MEGFNLTLSADNRPSIGHFERIELGASRKDRQSLLEQFSRGAKPHIPTGWLTTQWHQLPLQSAGGTQRVRQHRYLREWIQVEMTMRYTHQPKGVHLMKQATKKHSISSDVTSHLQGCHLQPPVMSSLSSNDVISILQ